MRKRLAVLLAAGVMTVLATASSALLIIRESDPVAWGGAFMRIGGDVVIAAREIPAGFQFEADTYRLRWDPEFAYSTPGTQPVAMDDETKARIKKVPESLSENAQYAALRIDGAGPEGLVAVILDPPKDAGQSLFNAYVDANRNWDLSDDPPSRVASGWRPSVDGGDMLEDLAVSAGEQPMSDWVTIRSRQGPADGWHGGRDIQIRLRPGLPAEFFEGSFDLGGLWYPVAPTTGVGQLSIDKKGVWQGKAGGASGEVEIVLVDMNNNGIYGDRTGVADGFPDMSTGDPLLVNGNQIRLTGATPIAGKFYHVRPNCIGNLLAIRQYSGPMGALSVKAPGMRGSNAQCKRFELVGSRTGSVSLGGEEIELPAGKYKVNSFVVSLSREGSGSTDLNCKFDGGLTAEVKAGEQTDLEVSGGLRIVMDPGKEEIVYKQNQQVRFDLIPKIGDFVTVNSVTGEMPQVEFLDKAGKTLRSMRAGRT